MWLGWVHGGWGKLRAVFGDFTQLAVHALAVYPHALQYIPMLYTACSMHQAIHCLQYMYIPTLASYEKPEPKFERMAKIHHEQGDCNNILETVL